MTTTVTAVLLPDGSKASSGTFDAGAVPGSINDSNDGTYMQHAVNVDTPYYQANLSSFVLPSGATINWVQMRVRASSTQDNTATKGMFYELRRGSDDATLAYNAGYPSNVNVGVGIANYDSAQFSSYSPSPTAVFTQAVIDALYVHVGGAFSSLHHAGDKLRTHQVEVYINYTYNAPPGTPTGLAVTSGPTITTPTFQATVPDDGTAKARFELYQNDGVTLIGTVDSGFVSGNSVASATYSSALAVGQYKVRAQSIDDGGLSSAWTGLVSFIVATAVTKDSIYLWNVADPTTQVTKDSTYLWSVDELKAKQFGLVWTVFQGVTIDLNLLWNVSTPWVKVIEDVGTVWTGVPEG